MNKRQIKILIACIALILIAIIGIIVGRVIINRQNVVEETTEEKPKYAQNDTTEYTSESTTEVTTEEIKDKNYIVDEVYYDNFNILSDEQKKDQENLNYKIVHYRIAKKVSRVEITDIDTDHTTETTTYVLANITYDDGETEKVACVYNFTDNEFYAVLPEERFYNCFSIDSVTVDKSDDNDE